jgi:hypothetical protein
MVFAVILIEACSAYSMTIYWLDGKPLMAASVILHVYQAVIMNWRWLGFPNPLGEFFRQHLLCCMALTVECRGGSDGVMAFVRVLASLQCIVLTVHMVIRARLFAFHAKTALPHYYAKLYDRVYQCRRGGARSRGP